MRRRPSTHSTTPERAVPGNDDGVTDETRDVEIDRRTVEDGRSRRLSEPSRAENGDLVPHRERLGLIVGDEHCGRALCGQRSRDRLASLRPEVCVEAGERLVEQHDPRLRRERSREADAALLSSGELLRAPARHSSSRARRARAPRSCALRSFARREGGRMRRFRQPSDAGTTHPPGRRSPCLASRVRRADLPRRPPRFRRPRSFHGRA